jgi:hypothetical protein
MADAPREEGGAEATPGEGPWPRLEGRFERGLSLFRITVIIPVIVLLLSALASFVYGTDVFVRSVTSFVEKPRLSPAPDRPVPGGRDPHDRGLRLL